MHPATTIVSPPLHLAHVAPVQVVASYFLIRNAALATWRDRLAAQ
jgi:hypothetical protein